MIASQLDIDAIVREVLRRLDEPLSRGQARADRGMAPAEPRDEACLRLDERVVTVATLEARLGTAKRISLPAGAIVTPAARDMLRENGVAIGHAVANVAPAESSRLMLVGVGLESAATTVVTGEVDDAELIENECPVAVTRQLLDRIASGDGCGVLLTGEPVAAICAANRRPGVRAAWAVSVAAVSQAMKTMAANLLIIDPGAHSVYELRSMVRQFVRGPREFSSRWKKLVE